MNADPRPTVAPPPSVLLLSCPWCGRWGEAPEGAHTITSTRLYCQACMISWESRQAVPITLTVTR